MSQNVIVMTTRFIGQVCSSPSISRILHRCKAARAGSVRYNQLARTFDSWLKPCHERDCLSLKNFLSPALCSYFTVNRMVGVDNAPLV